MDPTNSLSMNNRVVFPPELAKYIEGNNPFHWLAEINANDRDGSLLELFFRAVAFSNNTPDICVKRRELRTVTHPEVLMCNGEPMPLFASTLLDIQRVVGQVYYPENRTAIIEKGIIPSFCARRSSMSPERVAAFERLLQEYPQEECEEGYGSNRVNVNHYVQQYNGIAIDSQFRKFLSERAGDVEVVDLTPSCAAGNRVIDVLSYLYQLTWIKLADDSATEEVVSFLSWHEQLKYLDVTLVTQFTHKTLQALYDCSCARRDCNILMSSHGVQQILEYSSYPVRVVHQFPVGLSVEKIEIRIQQFQKVFKGQPVAVVQQKGKNGQRSVTYTCSNGIKTPVADKDWFHVHVPSPLFELVCN